MMTSNQDANGWVLAKLDELKEFIQNGGTEVVAVDEEWSSDGTLTVTVQMRRELQG